MKFTQPVATIAAIPPLASALKKKVGDASSVLLPDCFASLGLADDDDSIDSFDFLALDIDNGSTIVGSANAVISNISAEDSMHFTAFLTMNRSFHMIGSRAAFFSYQILENKVGWHPDSSNDYISVIGRGSIRILIRDQYIEISDVLRVPDIDHMVFAVRTHHQSVPVANHFLEDRDDAKFLTFANDISIAVDSDLTVPCSLVFPQDCSLVSSFSNSLANAGNHIIFPGILLFDTPFHMVGFREVFSNYQPIHNKSTWLSRSQVSTPVLGRGSFKILVDGRIFELHDVFHVPAVNHLIISVQKF